MRYRNQRFIKFRIKFNKKWVNKTPPCTTKKKLKDPAGVAKIWHHIQCPTTCLIYRSNVWWWIWPDDATCLWALPPWSQRFCPQFHDQRDLGLLGCYVVDMHHSWLCDVVCVLHMVKIAKERNKCQLQTYEPYNVQKKKSTEKWSS